MNKDIKNLTPNDLKENSVNHLDQINLATIDTALNQATELGLQNRVENLNTMRQLVAEFPGRTVVEANELSQIEPGFRVEVTSMDLILHQTHGPERDIAPTRTVLPLLSMRHGVVLAHNTAFLPQGFEEFVDIFNFDLPRALSSVPDVPETGVRIITHTYDGTPSDSKEIYFGRFRQHDNISPIEFLKMSLDPAKKVN